MNRLVFLSLTVVLVMAAGCDSVESDGLASALEPQTSATDPINVAGGDDPINQLTSACQGWWRINNDARPAQTYTWEHLPSGETGEVHVAAGDRAFFQTLHTVGSANTTKLFVDGALVSTKASNNEPCWTLSGRVNAVPDGSTDPSAGDGIANVRVQVFFSGADPATDTPIAETLTDSDGVYTFVSLPAWTSNSVPYVEYLVVVPEESDGAFNEDLFAFFDAINNPLAVTLPNEDVDNADLGFDGDDPALIAELEHLNTSGQRDPWSAKDLRKAFDRARKGKPCHTAVLCREDLLAVTRAIVDDPDSEGDAFFGLSFPYSGPDTDADGEEYTDQELLEWGYEVLKDVPRGPQDENARLYSLVFACQINSLAGPAPENGALDRAIQAYLEADVNANPPSGMVVPLQRSALGQRKGGGGGGTIEVARTYLGGGGGGTIEE